MSPANRYQSSMANLAQALASGLDPQQGFSIWNDLESQHAQTLAAQQTQLDSLRQLAVQRAQQGVPFDQVQTEFQGLMPHMSQKLSMGLDDTLTSLYPAGVPGQPYRDSQMSTLAPPGQPFFKPFDANDMADISKLTAGIIHDAQQPTAAGVPPSTPTLEDVRRQVAVNYGPVYDYHQQEADAVIMRAYQMMVEGSLDSSGQHTALIGSPVQAPYTGAPNRLGY